MVGARRVFCRVNILQELLLGRVCVLYGGGRSGRMRKASDSVAAY